MSNHFARIAKQDRLVLKHEQQELTGIAEGILADGVINIREIQFLKDWFEKKEFIAYTFPGDVVYASLCDLLDGDVLDEGKETRFVAALKDLVGETNEETRDTPAEGIPFFIDQVDVVEFEDKKFYFTGLFRFEDCRLDKGPLHAATKQAGGKVANSVIMALDYLVVGTDRHPQWTNNSFGTSIEKASRYRKEKPKNKSDIKIIHEDTWVRHLP